MDSDLPSVRAFLAFLDMPFVWLPSTTFAFWDPDGPPLPPTTSFGGTSEHP